MNNIEKNSVRNLLYFLVLGFIIGWFGRDVVESGQDGSVYTDTEIQLIETTACGFGVVETLQFIVLKTRDKPANCNFSKR